MINSCSTRSFTLLRTKKPVIADTFSVDSRTGTVTVSAGGTAGSIAVTNGSGTLRMEGGGFAGATLVKSGSGTLVLAAANTLTGGVTVTGGTLVPAEILSADDTQVVFRRVGIAGVPETLLMTRVAGLLFQPVPAAKLGLLHRPATGLVLRNGDFMEGDFQSLQRNQVHLTSVLFGVRRVRIENSVIALMLHPFRDPPRIGPAPAAQRP